MEAPKVTQEELFKLADKAGIGFVRYSGDKNVEKMETFAKLVALHEREACAQLCESSPEPDGFDLADRIRARGQA